MDGQNIKAHIALGASMVIFGLMAPFAKDAMSSGPTGLQLSTLRIAGAALLFWLAMPFVKRQRVDKCDFPKIALARLLGVAASQATLVIGISQTYSRDVYHKDSVEGGLCYSVRHIHHILSRSIFATYTSAYRCQHLQLHKACCNRSGVSIDGHNRILLDAGSSITAHIHRCVARNNIKGQNKNIIKINIIKTILAVAVIALTARQANAQKMENNVPMMKLSNGVEMPELGFGTLRLPMETCAADVSNAIRLGFRLIDTAKNYVNEEEVGKGIKISGVPRDSLFITSKLWIKDYGYESAKKAFNATLKRLGVDYLDLYLLHQPFGDVYGAWRALEDLYEEGKVRAIGVSNFTPDRLVDLCMTAHIKPMVNQIEFSPYYQRWRDKVWNDKYGVKVEAWGVMCDGNHPELLQEPTLVDIGKKYGKSPAQVILRYLTQRGVITLCCTSNPAHQQEDISIFNFKLDDGDMHAIDLMDKGHTMSKDHRNPADVEWFHTKATR